MQLKQESDINLQAQGFPQGMGSRKKLILYLAFHFLALCERNRDAAAIFLFCFTYATRTSDTDNSYVGVLVTQNVRNSFISSWIVGLVVRPFRIRVK